MATTLFTNAVTLTDAAWFNDVDTNTYPLTAVAGTNAITATGPTSLTAYGVGHVYKLNPAASNSGATTINISAISVKNVFYRGAACVGGELISSVPTLLYYDGTQMNIIGYGALLSVANTWTGAQTFRDNKFIITDDLDITKILNLQLSGITTGTTRTATWPDKSGTVAMTSDITSSFTNSINDFRLTLTTGVPVTTADVTAAPTIYTTPYVGNRIALYDGVNWNVRTSAQFNVALGTITSALPYDVFCYDNATVPTLEILAWTNGTTRATALAYQDGVLSKSGALTRRYLGTFYTTSTTTTEDSKAKRYLFNYYNPVLRQIQGTFSVDRSTTSATYVELNAEDQCQWVTGVSEDTVALSIEGSCMSNGNSVNQSAIGLDSTTVALAGSETVGYQASASIPTPAASTAYTLPSVGIHYATIIARVNAGLTLTFATASGASQVKAYLSVVVKA